MNDWLVKRLTPYRSSVERWVSLASSTQKVWEEHFDPALSRLERLRSYYQADTQDLARLIREMGDYFAEDLPGDTDRPIAVSWRRMELEYKDLELILSSVFRRHFGNLPVTWFPVFAPLDEAYGVGFKAAEGPWPELKNIPPEGYFLTSRGRLGADHGYLLKMGLHKEAFLEKGIPILKRTKPLHIVYDGPLWYIRFELPVSMEFDVTLWSRDDWTFLPFSTVGGRFDFIPADEIPVDLSTMSCRWEREDNLMFSFKGLPGALRWHLDWHLPEGFPPDWMPLDITVAGLDGEESFSRLVLQEHWREGYTMAMRLASGSSSAAVDLHANMLAVPGKAESNTSVGLHITANAFVPERLWHMDTYMPEGFPAAGWLPLDVVVPKKENGQEQSHIPLLRLAFRENDADVCSIPALPAHVVLRHDSKAVSSTSFLTAVQHHIEQIESTSLPCDVMDIHTIRYDFSVHHPLFVSSPSSSMGGERNNSPVSTAFFADYTSALQRSAVSIQHLYVPPEHHLDRFPRFDEVPADFCPLDMPVGGSYV